jgi:hypothetical protein
MIQAEGISSTHFMLSLLRPTRAVGGMDADEFDLGTAGFHSRLAPLKPPRSPGLRIVSAPSSPLTRKTPKIKLPPKASTLQLDDGDLTPTPASLPFFAPIDDALPSLRRTHSANGLRKAGDRSRRDSYTRSKFPSAPLPIDQLEAFRRHALCFALVQFDLDKGPDLDAVYPPCAFTSSEKGDIAFSSFPDTSASTSTESTILTFNWRIPREASSKDPNPFYYGYCSFLQQRDEKLRRNYLQRSLVIITHRPDLHGLFMTLAEHLGSLHSKSEHQAAVLLEVACSNISHWPAFTPGVLLELNFMGNLISLDVPLDGQPQAHDARTAASPRIPRHAVRPQYAA